MHHHRGLQRRFILILGVVAVLIAAIAIPLITNNDLRYNLAMWSRQIPGHSVEKLAEGDSGALLIVVPLSHGQDDGPTPWLFRAQFIAWPTPEGIELENLETGAQVLIPIDQIEFIAANADGTTILMRGDNVETGEPAALTVSASSMEVSILTTADSVPDEPGDWETSIWTKTGDRCNRPSPNKRFLGCFTNPELASYAVGDWQLDLQYWGDYTKLFPIFRGQGFLPIVGFAQDDTVVYFQNERGIWRTEIPPEILEDAPPATPFSSNDQSGFGELISLTVDR